MEIQSRKLSVGFWGSVLFLAATSALADQTTQSSSVNRFLDPQNYHGILTLSGGFAVGSLSNNEVFENDFRTYSYYGDSNSTVGSWGGLIGVEGRFDYAIAQLGISFYQTSDFKIDGDLQQGVDPQDIYSYEYDYQVVARQLLVESKILFIPQGRYHPYIIVGLGESFNTSSDFDNTTNPELTTTGDYESNTESSFSYLLGFGVDVDLHKNVRLGAGYRYANYGDTSLGDGKINSIPIKQTLTTQALNTSGMLVQLTFVI